MPEGDKVKKVFSDEELREKAWEKQMPSIDEAEFSKNFKAILVENKIDFKKIKKFSLQEFALMVVSRKVINTNGMIASLTSHYKMAFDALMKNKKIGKIREQIVDLVRSAVKKNKENSEVEFDKTYEFAHIHYEQNKGDGKNISEEYAQKTLKSVLISDQQIPGQKQKIIENLLKKNVFKGALNFKDDKGNNIVDYAVKGQFIKEANFLVKKGGKFDARKKDFEDILVKAVDHNLSDLAKFLLDNGVDANVKNKNQDSLLHICSQRPDLVNMAKLLLEKGAKIDTKDFLGQTVLDKANMIQNKEFVDAINAQSKFKVNDKLASLRAGIDTCGTPRSSWRESVKAESKDSSRQR